MYPAASCLGCMGFPINPRITLLHLGVFGDPSTLPLKTLLSRAFEMFKRWRKQHRVPCSQKRFTPGLVIKKMHGAYLSAKAYNGRVILEWLAEISRDYAANNPADTHVSVQAAALKLGSLHDFDSSSYDVCKCDLIYSIAHPSHAMRTSFARWFGLCERAGRFLTRGSISSCHGK